GLFFLTALLRFYQIRESIIAILLLATSFGTHLFVYTVVEGGMSHVFSFAFVSGFLYYSKRFAIKKNLSDVYRMALLLGLIVLCRPINGLVVLFLITLSGSLDSLKTVFRSLFSNLKVLGIGFLLFALVLGIQL